MRSMDFSAALWRIGKLGSLASARVGKTSHIADAVEGPGMDFAQVRQMWGATRLQQSLKERCDRLNAAEALINRHLGRAKPSAVTGSHRIEKVSQALGDLVIGEPFQCWLRGFMAGTVKV